MSGAHRSTTQSPINSARKSAAWLITLLALCAVLLAFLALLAFAAYFAITYVPAHSSPGWVLSLAIALQSAGWLLVLGDLAWSLMRKQPRSLAQRTRLTRKLLPPLAGTIALLAALGQQYGLMYGTLESALTWTSCVLLLLVAAYTAMRGNLLPALRARLAARRSPSD